MPRARWLWRNLVRRREADEDLRAELEAFCAERPQGARLETLREEVRGARIGAGIEGWARDLRYAVRMLRKAPLVTAVCVAAFALGIGANAVVCSLANGLLWRPLPVRHPERLQFLQARQRGALTDLAASDVAEVRAQTGGVFSQVVEASFQPAGLGVDGQARTLWASYVNSSFFDLMGIRPALGAFFSERDGDQRPVAVISYAYWQARFAGDRGIIGRAALADGRAVTIIGVTPPGFHGFTNLFDSQAYLPIGLAPTRPAEEVLRLVLARLGNGISVIRAQAAVALVASRLARAHPASDHDLSIEVVPLGIAAVVTDSGPDPVVIASVLFLALAGVVLLLAAANVAGLLLARASARRREMAVRAALGASRGRLARQAGLEAFLLAALGGAVGLALGAVGSRAISALPPDLGFPLALDLSFDWRVYGYGVALVAVVALAAGIAPAWRAAHAEPGAALRSHQDGGKARRRRARGWMVGAEIAGSLSLLIVACLFVRSLENVRASNPGFDPARLTNYPFDAAGAGFNPAHGAEYFGQLLPRVRALPGVAGASLASSVPYGLDNFSDYIVVESSARTSGGSRPFANYDAVSPGYFSTLRIPLLRGRDFRSSDNAAAAAVAVVSETMARRYWPREDAIGRVFALATAPTRPLEIVGIAGDVRIHASGAVRPRFYFPLAQKYAARQVLQVRAAPGAHGVTAAVLRTAATVDREVPVGQIETMEETMNGTNGLFIYRLAARLAAALGLLGLALAVVGVYGFVAYAAAQRTHEMGVLTALGARRSQVLAFILRQTLIIVAVGSALGLLAAMGIARLVGGFLVGVSPLDTTSYLATALLLAGVAVAAAFIPAWRATGIDPLQALRCE